ncbi:MAG: hypothetical protein K2X37_01460, partial [Chitinophagaceae bacterium]|nr:hypothetical protein [Chitinophagaceae bacterium]
FMKSEASGMQIHFEKSIYYILKVIATIALTGLRVLMHSIKEKLHPVPLVFCKYVLCFITIHILQNVSVI